MPLDLSFSCPLPNGVHARPASALEAVARRFSAEVMLENQRTGCTADVKSILSVVAADIRFQDPCRLSVTGADEAPAMEALKGFIQQTLPHCDDAELEATAAAGQPLPPMLRSTKATFHRGIAVVPGIGSGRIVKARPYHIPEVLLNETVSDPEAECRRLEKGFEELLNWYDERIAALPKSVEAEMLGAHRSLARDKEFCDLMFAAIRKRGRTAAGAVAEAEAHCTAMLRRQANNVLRERTLDIRDVCALLLGKIYGVAAQADAPQLTGDALVIAESLTPTQFLALNRSCFKGLVLGDGGTTSHTVILARSYGIPTVVGVASLTRLSVEGTQAYVDADLGALVLNPDGVARRYYALEQARLEKRRKVLRQFAANPACSRDGARMEIAANIGSAPEAAVAFAAGAEGIGLFRTELLFLNRNSAPSEEEQYAAYREVLTAAGDRPVLIRTLDVGGDKQPAYLNLRREDNPCLGCRGVRLYRAFEPLFRSQVRALLRASPHGRLKILIPMVTEVKEIRWVRNIIAEEQTTCSANGFKYDDSVPVGAMIEVPAAALSVEELSAAADFFSIGSNDLLQYFVAADRANPVVADLYDPLNPAFLRLLQGVVEAARQAQKWIGFCGEIGGQARMLPLLAGLGLDEISASTPSIAGLKAGLAQLRTPECRDFLARATRCRSASEVAGLLADFTPERGEALLVPHLIQVEVDSTSKVEAIKQAVDLLWVYGRVANPRLVEEAVWEREVAYSTGFGHGLAMPHCKSKEVKANSLVVLKLRSPVPWGSQDEQPVRLLLLLTVREAEGATEHMKVFAKLARLVMHEDFRASLDKLEDQLGLCRFLQERLELAESS